MTNGLRLPEATQQLCDAFTDGLLSVLGSKLCALYVYGATVFPETAGTGDVDLHAIIETELTAAETEGIRALHRKMAKQFPPLGRELDAYVILLREALQSGSPVHQLDTTIIDNSWALHRAHLLAGRCIVLHGLAPSEILTKPTWDELDQALQGELEYVKDHLAQYPGYGVMNLCRLMYSYRTRDVVTSKFASAAWAATEYPEWRGLIDTARRSYTQELRPEEDGTLQGRAPQFFSFATKQIESHR